MSEREPAEVSIFPIPIRPDVQVRVQFPHNLMKAEAEKVARVVLALAKDSQ